MDLTKRPHGSVRDIPVVILAGGQGARFDHESQVTPKPMIKVAGQPILMHIMNSFVRQGFREFIVLSGYMAESIDGFLGIWGAPIGVNRYRLDSLIIDQPDHFTVQTVQTGHNSNTGKRLWMARQVIGARRFVLTYGDGLSDADMHAVIDQHDQTGAGVTVTAVHPPGRFGVIEFADDTDELSGSPTLVNSFNEKHDVGWINGGFMVVEPEFITQYIEGEFELESTALPELAASGGLHAYRHDGYWRCMDTRRDRDQIEDDVRRCGIFPWMR